MSACGRRTPCDKSVVPKHNLSSIDYRKDLKESGTQSSFPNGTPEFACPHGSGKSEFLLSSINVFSFTEGEFGE